MQKAIEGHFGRLETLALLQPKEHILHDEEITTFRGRKRLLSLPLIPAVTIGPFWLIVLWLNPLDHATAGFVFFLIGATVFMCGLSLLAIVTVKLERFIVTDRRLFYVVRVFDRRLCLQESKFVDMLGVRVENQNLIVDINNPHPSDDHGPTVTHKYQLTNAELVRAYLPQLQVLRSNKLCLQGR